MILSLTGFCNNAYVVAVVLVFRTWAIWGRNSKMAISLLVFGVSLAVPICLLAHFGLANIQCKFVYPQPCATELTECCLSKSQSVQSPRSGVGWSVELAGSLLQLIPCSCFLSQVRGSTSASLNVEHQYLYFQSSWS